MKTSIKRSICIGLVVLAIVGIAGCVGSDEQKTQESQANVTEPAAAPAAEPAETTPEPAPGTIIATFSGEESRTTEPFTVNSSTWKIDWQVQNSTKYDVTVFTAYLIDETGDSELLASTYSAAGETSYYYKPGTYHLKIDAGAMPYNITVSTA